MARADDRSIHPGMTADRLRPGRPRPKRKAGKAKGKAKPKPTAPPPMPRGRPKKFKPEYVHLAGKMAELGATDAEMADAFDCDIRTLTRWKYEHEDFAAALKVGKEAADARVADSLYRRAVGYNFDSVEIKMSFGVPIEVPVRKHVPADTTAAIFWLKNRNPGLWRDTKNIKHDIEEEGVVQKFLSGLQAKGIRPQE